MAEEHYIFLTMAHANAITFNNKKIYLMYGKQSPERVIYEGEFCRKLLSLIQERLIINGHDENRVIIIDSGDTDSSPRHRVTAVNRIIEECGLDKSKCMHFEPHLNASGMGKNWKQANGHKFFHNNKFFAKKIAMDLSTQFVIRYNHMMGNRGIARRYFSKSKCASVLGELYFMTNKLSVSHFNKAFAMENLAINCANSICDTLRGNKR